MSVDYRPVEGFPGYRVGNDGTVWSRFRRRGVGQYRTPDGPYVLLRPQPSNKGHLRVQLYRQSDAASPRVLVHHLVLNAFIGPCPSGMEACHGDGNPANNRVDNVRWDTRTENRADRARHGRGRSWSKLSEDDVARAKSLRSMGCTYAQIGASLGVSDTQASNICRGKQWKGAA